MMENKEEVSIRFKTMPLDLIDGDDLARETTEKWRKINNDRGEFLQKREEYTRNWRDLNIERVEKYFENSSDFHIPLTLFYGRLSTRSFGNYSKILQIYCL